MRWVAVAVLSFVGFSFAVDAPAGAASSPVVADADSVDSIDWDCGILGAPSDMAPLSPEEMTCNVVKMLNRIGLLKFVDEISFAALMVLFVIRSLSIAIGPNANRKFPPYLLSAFVAFMLFLGMSDIRSFLGDMFGSIYKVSTDVSESIIGESLTMVLDVFKTLSFEDTTPRSDRSLEAERAAEAIAAAALMLEQERRLSDCEQDMARQFAHEGVIRAPFLTLGNREADVDINNQRHRLLWCADSHGYATPGVLIEAFPELADAVGTLSLFSVGGVSGEDAAEAVVGAVALRQGPNPKALFVAARDNAKGFARALFRIVDWVLLPIFAMMNMVKFGSGLVYIVAILVLPIGAVMIVAGGGSEFFSNWFKVIIASVLTVIIMPVMWTILVQLTIVSPLMMVMNFLQEIVDIFNNWSFETFLTSIGQSVLQIFEGFALIPMMFLNFVLGLITSIGLIAYLQDVVVKFLAGAVAASGRLVSSSGGFFSRGNRDSKTVTADSSSGSGGSARSGGTTVVGGGSAGGSPVSRTAKVSGGASAAKGAGSAPGTSVVPPPVTPPSTPMMPPPLPPSSQPAGGTRTIN